ncbi:hypothetical protein GCM10009547_00130 [Sporichthya brevicatena]|uniref:Uncharacterized protein n=1 Tax=Sporichthya brevicatena TaxID=171442 RepID=A0ABN1G278_9ACTN
MTGAAAVSTAALVTLLPTSSALGSATAEPSSTTTLSAYQGQASANAAYFLAALPRFLIIENLVNGGGPTAQAALNSLGSSTGFASFPYPGDLAVAAPGLAGTLSGKPVPTYPFVVTSQYPSAQEVSLDQPGYHLDSVAHEREARSVAQAGARLAPSTDEGGAFATAEVVRSADNFVSAAESRLDLQIGVVAIHGAVSRAEVVIDNAGKVVRNSDFQVSSLSVNGVGVAVTEEGVSLVGSVHPAQKSLTVGNTTIRYVEATSTDDSVLAPGLQITTPMDVPAPVGRTVVTDFVIGRSFAQATGSSAPVAEGTAGSADNGTSGVTAPASPVDGVDTVAAAPVIPGVGTGVLPTGVAPVTPPGTQTFVLANTQPGAVSLPSLGAYPYLAGGALLFVLVSVGTRWVVGVRRSWS